MKKAFWILLGAIPFTSFSAPNPEVTQWVDQARKNYYEAMAKSDEAVRIKMLEEGQSIAQKAREKDPADAGAVFWWATSFGGIAQTKKNLWALNQLKKIEKNYLEVIEKDPHYDFAAGHRAVGLLYHEAPSFISIGSSRKAREHLEKAMTLYPKYPANMLAMARFLWDEGDKEKARELAKAVLEQGKELEKHPGYVWEGAEWLQKARAILDQK